jgi:integrase/recombinase XerD
VRRSDSIAMTWTSNRACCNSKFGKSRQIPVHPSTVQALAGYAERRDARRPRRDGRSNRHAPSSASFFTSTTGTRLLRDNVSTVFPRLVRDAGLDWSGHPRSPRAHDLRHSFAVNTLIGWYRQGLDVEQRLPLLSTYLGHVAPKSTYWYLSAVPELLELIADRLDATEGAQS